MFYAASRNVKAAAFFRLNFHRQMSGQWDLAANGASETRNRTQDAGDIVQFLAIETAFLLNLNRSVFAGHALTALFNCFHL